MADISDTVNEAVERASASRLNSIIAALVAITATFMAICNVKDGNVTQAMSQAQSNAVDSWSYFQAKSTKQAIAEAMVDQLEVQRLVAPPQVAALLDAKIAEYHSRVKRYEKEKTDIRKQAEGFQKQYDALNIHDDQFDLSEACLSLSIALFGVTALTQRRWLLFMAMAFMTTGLIFGLAGFFSWTIHPDAIVRWLS